MMPLILKLCCKLLDIIKSLKFESLLVDYFGRLLHPSTDKVLYIVYKQTFPPSFLDQFLPFMFDSNKLILFQVALFCVIFFLTGQQRVTFCFAYL